MPAVPFPPLDVVRESLDYDPLTGSLTWKSKRPRVIVGQAAGCITAQGYGYVGLCSRVYKAHRLVWFHYYGTEPPPLIDHINGVRHDNRIANLRAADQKLNAQNQRRAMSSNLASGLLGVSKSKQRWKAEIFVNGKKVYLGTRLTAEAAHDLYLQAKRNLHEGCSI